MVCWNNDRVYLLRHDNDNNPVFVLVSRPYSSSMMTTTSAFRLRRCWICAQMTWLESGTTDNVLLRRETPLEHLEHLEQHVGGQMTKGTTPIVCQPDLERKW